MKKTTAASLRLWCIASCCCLSAPSLPAGNLLDVLFPGDDLQTITVTDFTPEGRLRRLPTPAEPVYYAAVSAGYKDFGGIIAGERPISRELVNRTMLKVLAKQGYLPVGPGQRPDVILLWSWGTLNVERLNISDNGLTVRLNARQMQRFLGADKLGLTSKDGDPFPEHMLSPGLFFGGSARNLLDAADDNLYVTVIAAYDVKLRDPKHGVLLWNTRISCPARGFWLPDALPAMLAIASPHIGRETTRPVWIRATESFKPEVKLGDLKLVEYLESNKPAIVEAGPSS